MASVRGGTTVTVSMYGRMQGEASTVSCHFGTAVVAGEVRGDSSVVCVSPKTRSRSTVELRVSEGSLGAFLVGSLKFEYLEELRITGVRPSTGTLGRGTAVSVMLSGGISSASGLQCRFGAYVVTGDGVRMMSSSLVTCLAPVLREAEEVTVDVSANGGADFTNSGVEFMFEATATVEVVIPSQGAGGATGQTVTVVGQHFARTRDLSCWFGVNGTARARYFSSTVVMCGAPSRGAGTVTVVVSNNGVDAGTGRVGFMYGATRRVVLVEPTSGPKEGGTIVTVTGSNFDARATRTECIFGEKTVSGSLRDASTVVCTTPLSASGEVTLGLRQDGSQLEGVVVFEYFEAPTVESIAPSRGPAMGGVIVSVCGGGCPFGDINHCCVCCADECRQGGEGQRGGEREQRN
jgi:hypothetical protein